MMKWSPWAQPSATSSKKFLVKANRIKLQGFLDDDGTEKVMAVEMRWKGGPNPKYGFHRPPSKRRRKHVSDLVIVKNSESIDWPAEFHNTCSFSFSVGATANESAFSPWEVSFTLLYGAKREAKLAAVGKASLNLGELVSKMEVQTETEAKVPVKFHVAGANGEATLLVCFSFVEVRDSLDLPGMVQNSTESSNVEGTKGDELAYKKERLKSQEAGNAEDSDESAMFDSDVTSENELVSNSNCVDITSGIESGPDLSSETQLDSAKKAGFFSWKRRRLSFRPGKNKGEPLIKRATEDGGIDSVNPNSIPELDAPEQSCKAGEKEETSSSGHWEEKELSSRDGETKLKTNVFFASFDQRSDKAAGESACTALVAVIAHWLHSHEEEITPTRPQFDRLIIEGSSEWRNLCGKEDLINQYPNKHFDLETVMQAGFRPVSVSQEKSFVGFFGPEKFGSLKGVMSFDQIWDKIKSGTDEDSRPRLYIVSWNDHFFVLKVDPDAYYIIDTLGERLYEGCDRAYIMRFDDSTVMKGKMESKNVGSEGPINPLEESEGEICRGKECCREFVKRFFAAIPLRELELEEDKEPVSYLTLHQRLQIEFNFSSLLSSSSSVSTCSVSSLFSEDSVDL